MSVTEFQKEIASLSEKIDGDLTSVINRIEDLSDDNLANILIGLKDLYEIRFSELFETFGKLSIDFEFEQAIFSCWGFVDELFLLAEIAMETDVGRDVVGELLASLLFLTKYKLGKLERNAKSL